MEKRESAMNPGPESRPVAPPQASAPPPSAPPSYEEAVGIMGMNGVPGTVTPYPTGTGMPTQYGPPGMADGFSHTFAAQSQMGTEVRVVRLPLPYALGPGAVKMQCPTCLANIKTSTVSERQPSAHLCCIILCVLGCCLCSCLPYCMSAFLTVHHYCPSCKVYIGTWKG